MADDARNISFTVEKDRQSVTRPANTTAYTAGDVISAVTTNDHFTFTMLKTKPIKGSALHSATIERAVITSSQAGSPALDAELWLFDTDIAEVADNSAFAVTDAEILTCVGVIDFPVGDWKTGGANAVCQAENLNMVVKGASGSLYGQLVVRNAYTPASGEVIQVTLFYQQD